MIYCLLMILCTGTSKVGKPYKIGDRTADVILEIRNLQKKEVVAIDAISNQEFSEVFKLIPSSTKFSVLVNRVIYFPWFPNFLCVNREQGTVLTSFAYILEDHKIASELFQGFICINSCSYSVPVVK